MRVAEEREKRERETTRESDEHKTTTAEKTTTAGCSVETWRHSVPLLQGLSYRTDWPQRKRRIPLTGQTEKPRLTGQWDPVTDWPNSTLMTHPDTVDVTLSESSVIGARPFVLSFHTADSTR